MKILHHRVTKFVITGFTNTGIDFGSFAILLALSVNPVLAHIISVFLAIIVSFTLNSKWTFGDRDNGITRLVPYLIVTGISIGLSTSVVALGTHFLGDTPTMAMLSKVGASGFTMVYNYFMYNKFVFKEATLISERSE